MINNWMIPRNKRKLTSIVDSLSTFSILISKNEWSGDLDSQRQFESLLEKQHLKRVGTRRDMGAGGARTYESQLSALGLIYREQINKRVMHLTLAGEALINGDPPIPILRKQLLTFQYPSEYSVRQNVGISNRYQIRPFIFILRLLCDPEISTLTQSEVARFVITYAYTDDDFANVKKMIMKVRENGRETSKEDEEKLLEDTHGTRTNKHTIEERLAYLNDIANTFFNYLESTQLVERIKAESRIKLNPEMLPSINDYLQIRNLPLLKDADRPEVYQRRYGLDLIRSKDTRSFGAGQVSDQDLQFRIVMREYLNIISKYPIFEISDDLINKIAEITGVTTEVINKILLQKIPNALDTFEAGYWDMAHQGTEHAIDFEVSTKNIFQNVLKFNAEHIGQTYPKHRRGGNPDVFIVSLSDKYSGIIDTKAYSAYGLDNDHRIRMITDYIPDFRTKNINGESIELAFYMYIAGGFDNTIDSKIGDLSSEASLKGSAINASNMIRLLKKHTKKAFTHKDLHDLFTINREILPSDF